MSVLSNMIKELRERKLWPIAIGLVVAVALLGYLILALIFPERF